MDASWLFAVAITGLTYGLLGLLLRRRPPPRRRPITSLDRALTIHADTRVSTFQWLAVPMLLVGALALLGAVVVLITK